MDNRKKKIYLLLALVLGCIITSVVSNFIVKNKVADKASVNQVQATATSKKTVGKNQKEQILVSVSGAVVAPGVYELPANARVEDALALAGGVLEEANTEKLNFARKLKDGSQVYVPYQKEAKASTAKHSKGSSRRATVAAGTAEKSFQRAAEQKNLADQEPLNINTATQEELETLPGIGPALAQRIIAQRQKRSFTSVGDLARVKGLSQTKINKLRAYVVVE